MEETLGKRIAAHRKRLGITQDRLAEQLGVTAQAVSKWENDQSCPDITMLPKLAALFGISVDALLGLSAPEKSLEAEVVDAEQDGQEPEGLHFQNGNCELHLGSGKKSRIWFAVWVLLMGGMMLYNLMTYRVVSLWDMAWPSALMLFGLSGLYPKFSFFRLGCALFGGYSLLENLRITGLGLSSQLLLIAAVLLFGLSLLVDALRRPNHSSFSVTRGKTPGSKRTSGCTLDEDRFESSLAFGDDRHSIDLPRLSGGSANVSFGELTVDLTGCEEFGSGCHIEANCSFGEMTVLVPRRCRAEVNSSVSFANVDIHGKPDPDAADVITIDANVSFGNISVEYI